MYSLRIATNNDCDYLYSLLTITMKQYYIETYGEWNDKVEHAYFDKSFKDNKYQIISYKGHDVGCLVIKYNQDEIFIIEFQILPKYQNKGIGSMVLKNIIKESEKLKFPIKLEVLKSNVKAQKLYQRMYFIKSGESKSHITLIRNP